LVDAGASKRLALLGAVGLLHDERAMPGKDRIRFNETGHLLQCLLAQLLADLGQAPSLRVGQLDTTCELPAQDTVFRDQVFVAQQEFLIH
jgi:hypothetical protein